MAGTIYLNPTKKQKKKKDYVAPKEDTQMTKEKKKKKKKKEVQTNLQIYSKLICSIKKDYNKTKYQCLSI